MVEISIRQTWLLFLIFSIQTRSILASTQALLPNIRNVSIDYRNDVLNSSKTRRKLVIGIVVESKRWKDFIEAQRQFRKTDQNASILYRVVRNDPYDVLRTICGNLTGVNGLVFVCGEPCATMTAFASLIGISGTLVRRRSDDHSTLFTEAPQTFLDIKPPLHLQNQALLQLMTQFQWRTICLIHDTDPRTIHLVEDLQNTLKKSEVEIMDVIRLDGQNSTIDSGLTKVYGKVRVFVLFCTERIAEIVLQRAKNKQLTATEHAWIVGETVLENRRKIPDSFPIGLLGIEYDYRNKHVQHIVDAIRTVHYGLEGVTQNNTTWLGIRNADCYNATLLTERDRTPLYEAMKKASFNGLTGKVKFTQDGFRQASRYNFVNLQQQRDTRQLVWEKVGNLENGHVTLDQIIWPGGVMHTPSGVPRVRLRVVMYEVAPLLYVKQINASAKDCLQGMKCILVTKDKTEVPMCCFGLCIDLLSLIGRDLDLDPEIRVIERGRAGSLKNGRWTGLIGRVFDGEADMAMSSISITEERSKYIDFSAPFIHTGTTILVARRHGSFTGDGFLKPFEVKAWILLFGVLYVVAFVVFVLESKNPGLQRKKNKDYAGQFDIHTSIWLIYSRLFGGNLDAHSPRFISSRVVLGSWSFSSLMVAALYTANLAAFMVQKEETFYIDGINDSKIQQPSDNLKFTTILDTSVGRYFKNNFPHIYKFMEKQHRVNHSKDGVQAVLDKKIDAFIWETVSLQQYTAKDTGCRLLIAGKPFDQTGYAAVFQKNSKWTRNVTEMILKYQTSSKSKEMQDKWQKSYCTQATPTPTISKLGFCNLVGVFYLLLVGIGLSLLVLLGENIFSTFHIRLKRETTTPCTLTNQDRLRLQQDVASIEDVLQANGMPDNQVLLQKIEQELKRTLLELQELQEQTEKSFINSTFQSIGSNHLETNHFHDAMGSLTLSDMKKIIEIAKKGRSPTERESVV